MFESNACTTAGHHATRSRSGDVVPGGALQGLRLTRRGRVVLRLVVSLGFTVMVAALAALFTAAVDAPARAGDVPGTSPRTHVVAPGETLWGIAAELAPSADRLEVVSRLARVNGIQGGRLVPGQRLVVALS